MPGEIAKQGSNRWIAGLLLGAALMYMLDPDRGRRRRALARDRVQRASRKTSELVGAARRDARLRWQGVLAQLSRPLRGTRNPGDSRLAERVRARIGRAVSHSRALSVAAQGGRITLSGPILAREVPGLLAAAGKVPGVREIENRLEPHIHADVPSLQGAHFPPGERASWLQHPWPPSLRLAALAGGGALALYGLRERGLRGWAAAGAGALLAVRAGGNAPIRRLAGIGVGRHAIDLAKTIDVRAPLPAVYELWRRFEDFPRFMSHVLEVRDLGEGRSRWVVRGPAGVPIEWESVITRDVPNRELCWKSERRSLVQHLGTVRFEPHGNETRIEVRIAYNAAGALGHALASALGASPQHKMNDDLMRMKTFVETGQPAHDAAHPERSPSQPAAASGLNIEV